MSLDHTYDNSALFQVMAWCRQATSHYLSQCWPRSLSPYGISGPQWVKQNTTKCAHSLGGTNSFRINGHLWGESRRSSMDSPDKEPVIRKFAIFSTAPLIKLYVIKKITGYHWQKQNHYKTIKHIHINRATTTKEMLKHMNKAWLCLNMNEPGRITGASNFSMTEIERNTAS